VASVELKGLGKRYGSAVAVDDVSLLIEHGQLVCLLGPSGCGKTTTLRLLAGFIEPSAGEIVVGGKMLSSTQRTVPPEGRNMSMIFQSYALWPHMTVAENVAYGLRIRKMDKATIESKLKAILSTTKLEALAERYPGELSGGQQQRVSLARALVVDPETLLLDEPLSNLDASLREEMRFEIRRLHEQFEITTLYVTHDQAEAMVIADRVAVLERGRVAQIGAPDELYEAPRTRFVAEFIGKTNLIEGRAEDAGTFARGSLKIRLDGAGLVPGAAMLLSVRPHEIELSTDAGGGALRGIVRRASYVGDAVDYQIEIEGSGVTLRAAGPPSPRLAVGAAVAVRVRHGRALPG
jgi:iron(III) transport system ATP-binding protein